MVVGGAGNVKCVLTIFGTRPEAIKVAPVLRELALRGRYRTVNVVTSQHTDLLTPFLRLFEIRTDHDLAAMQPGQPLNQLLARVIAAVDPILAAEAPDLVLVQGDTTSALGGSLAAFQRRIPVGHIEAGLRSANPMSPFPEEMNRRLISQLSSYHFAPTRHNVDLLVGEGVAADAIFLTGNPVIDAVGWIMRAMPPSPALRAILDAVAGLRLVVLTTHRRENFGEVMRGHLETLRRFVEAHDDVALVFPVHANPAVREVANGVLAGVPRVQLIQPLDYADFLHLMAAAWLIASDSGGVQEEVPTLGKPLLVLRENTERPEALDCGVARLVGHSAERFHAMLEEAAEGDSWMKHVRQVDNPFGAGDSAVRIVNAIERILEHETDPRSHPGRSKVDGHAA
ncbi:MAG: UDP-N-acetylglucosamine 2-epimerase (non-hydrolyzing) [Rhodospirillales bacterium]